MRIIRIRQDPPPTQSAEIYIGGNQPLSKIIIFHRISLGYTT